MIEGCCLFSWPALPVSRAVAQWENIFVCRGFNPHDLQMGLEVPPCPKPRRVADSWRQQYWARWTIGLTQQMTASYFPIAWSRIRYFAQKSLFSPVLLHLRQKGCCFPHLVLTTPGFWERESGLRELVILENRLAKSIGHLKKKRTLGKVLQTTAQIPGQIESPPALLVKASYQYYSQRQDILHIFPPLKCIRDGFRFHLMYSSQCFCLPHYEIRDFLSLCFHSCRLYCFVAAPRAFLSPF